MGERSLGLQTWSVRDHWGDDPLACIQAIAELGYDAIELHGCDPALVEDLLVEIRAVGLSIGGYHAGEDRLKEPEALLKWAGKVGCSLLILPYTSRRSASEFEELLDILQSASEQAEPYGITVAYHNHSFEFEQREDGSRIIDQVVARAELALQIDLGWAWFAGEDPLAFLRRFGDRCVATHLKDLTGRPSGPPPAGKEDALYCPLGEGACGFGALIEALGHDEGGRLVVEFDASPTCDSLEAARRSLKFVRSHANGVSS